MHCWVVDCPEVPGTGPGLLVRWHKVKDGWEGEVVLVAQGTRGPLVVTLRVASRYLRPL